MSLTTGEKSIRMRLSKIGFNTYAEYLHSEHWKEFRKRVFKRKDIQRLLRKYGEFVCEFCFNGGLLNVHHRTYKRLGSEYLMDVVLICESCHERAHFGFSRSIDLWRRTKKSRRAVTKK